MVQDFRNVSSDPKVQARYIAMRRAGESHNMAEILATRSFPGVKTDAIFTEGRFSSDSGKNPYEQQWLIQQAEEAGVSTTGKYYSRALASYPGDPTAWISDRHDALRVAQEKGMKMSGYVEYTPPEVEPMPDIAIGEDIIQESMELELAKNPNQNLDDLREYVTALRTGQIDENPLRVSDDPGDLGIP